MPLYLSNRPELAFIAMAIRKAHDVFETREKGGYLGRTALQKILYFLVRRDVPLPYRFEIYSYGPFCSDIYHDVECLQADEVVVDKAEGTGKYWNYAPGPAINELLAKYRERLEPYEGVIAEVVALFADLDPGTLELMATLDYLHRDEKARLGGLPPKERVVDRFIQVKKERFSRERIEHTYDDLLRARLLT